MSHHQLTKKLSRRESSGKDNAYLALTREIPIFKALTENELKDLASTMAIHRYDVNQNIIEFGEEGNCVHFLIQGKADVISEFGISLEKVSGPDAFFGEISLTEHVPRTATVKAITPCITFTMSKEAVDALSAKFPVIGKQIVDSARKRMQMYLERNVLA